MMKSFFKKLAFVMALAMVVSMAAPAAKVAVAADKDLAITYQNENHYTISEVNLANVGDTEDLKFLWAPSNWKELGVQWTSSNENVVTVDSNGVVTAVAAGTADVSVAVGTETATVTVNCVDLPKYTVTMGTSAEDNNITEYTLEKVDDTIDLAFFGIKDYARDDYNGNGVSRYFCEWDTTDPEVATVDNKGLVTAVAPGKAKITLIVWNLELGKKVDVEPCWITVPEVVAPVTNVVVVNDRNKTQNTVEIDLPKAGSIGLADVELFRVYVADNDENGDGVIDERDIDKPYESVYLYDVKPAGENFDLITFDDFIHDALYEIQVKGYDPVRFTASVGDVAKVEVLLADGASLATEETDLDPAHVKVKLTDAKGVDVTTRYIDGIRNDDASNVTFWLLNETAPEYSLVDYNAIEFYENGIAQVMATYDNNGVPVPSDEPLEVSPAGTNAYDIKRVVSWSLVNPTDGKVKDWKSPVHEVPAGEYGYVIATLLEDTRGNYFTTHQPSTATKYEGKEVYYTEDESKAFWIHGFRAEYRAMDPDKMLVEDYGDVATYKLGQARYALYLYNQFNSADAEFIKELYSQYVKVCHPMQMTDMKAITNITILTNTEYDEEVQRTYENANGGTTTITLDPGLASSKSNSYYSLFSRKTLVVDLMDIHDIPAKEEHAREADFEIKLITAKAANETAGEYEALKNLIEVVYADELNNDTNIDDLKDGNRIYAKRNLVIEANDFAAINCKKNQVKFTITENVTKKSQTITVTLKRPVTETDPEGATSAKVATIDEYFDKLGIKLPFEKFITNTKGFTVQQKVTNATTPNTIYSVLLEQVDKNGNKIGIDNNIFVANKLDVKSTDDVNLGQHTLDQGDRVLIIKGPDGKIYPSNGVVYGEYKNPAYTTKVPTRYSMQQTTDNLGVTVDVNAGYATSASAAAAGIEKDVDVNQYEFVFRTLADDSLPERDDLEIIYAKSGRYTVTIKTVKNVDRNTGAITFTKSTGLTDSFTITVANDNAQVEYAGRDITRVEGAVTGYNWSGNIPVSAVGDNYNIKNAEYGDNNEVKKLILKAFNFKFTSGSAWDEAWDNGALVEDTIKLSAEDILYYTYTLTPTNKQVVINQVVFAVPADAAADKKGGYGWYRSEATVNRSLTFDYE